MSQKAEVKVVVDTNAAEAALRRLEAEARRIEERVEATGKKARANDGYDKANAAAEDGHAQHNSAVSSGGGINIATAASAGLIAARMDNAKANARSLTKDAARQALWGRNKGSTAARKEGGKAVVSAVSEVGAEPAGNSIHARANRAVYNLAKFSSGASDLERLENISGSYTKNRWNRFRSWMNRSNPDWSDVVQHEIRQQWAPLPKTASRNSLFVRGFQKKITAAAKGALSLGFGVGGVRGFLGKVFNAAMIGMFVQQLGQSSPGRINALEKGGLAGYGGHIWSNIAAPTVSFVARSFLAAKNLFTEATAIVGWIGGYSKYDLDTLRDLTVSTNEEAKAWSKWAGEDDVLNAFIQAKIQEKAPMLGDYLTAAGRWGTEKENRMWALQALETAEKRAKKRAELGNQG